MAKLSKDDLQRIVEKQMPKYKLTDTTVSTPAADTGGRTRAKPEGQTPDLQTLRKKYLRNKFLNDSSNSTDAGTRGDEGEPNGEPAIDTAGDETEIVMVEPKVSPHPLDRGSRPKAVVVSTTQKKIVGEQG
jgi:hypothetical protein